MFYVGIQGRKVVDSGIRMNSKYPPLCMLMRRRDPNNADLIFDQDLKNYRPQETKNKRSDRQFLGASI